MVSVSRWLLRRREASVPLLFTADRELPPAHLWTIVRQDRHPLRGALGGFQIIASTELGEKLSTISEHGALDATSTSYLEHAMESMNFSTRAYDRILRVASIIIDHEGMGNMQSQQILEAIQYRSPDRKLFS